MKKLLVALASIFHFVPHPFGVSPIAATALYAGAYGERRSYWLVALIPLFVGHLLTGFFDPVVMAFVYAGFVLCAMVGRAMLRSDRSRSRIGTAVLVQATVFFLVSNFSIWLVGMYPPTAAGLLQCYVNGLPFLAQAVLVDSAYCFVIFGLHHLLDRNYETLHTA
ncbi:MAG: hypothetical protein K0U72_01050 [Gammaproteobacteria bacterium]|nr:hypothetical protein [Gammaproteobacteria bacterium]